MVPEVWYCCTANGWENEVKANQLSTLLEGEALVVWLDSIETEQKSYKSAKAKIIEWMGYMQFTSMDNFHYCHLLPGESLSVFVHELKHLLDHAMPEADVATQKQL